MNDVLSFYQKQAQEVRSTVPLLAKIQSEALTRLMKYGFPIRKDEAWKYSPPDLFLKERYQLATSAVPSLRSQRSHLAPVVPYDNQAHQLFIENGHVHYSDLNLPSDLFIGSFEEALTSQPGLMEPYFKQLSAIEHGFHALNSAMLQTSLVIYVPKNQRLSSLTLSHWQNQSKQAVYARFLVILESGASLTLIDDYAGDAGCDYFTNSVTDVFLHESAELTHIQIQRESLNALHLSHVFTHQAVGSAYKSHVIHVGGKWVRCDKSVSLEGEKASCLLNGVYCLQQKQHIDQHTTITHAVGSCESQQDYKGVLTGPSRAVFNGRVVVAKDAQHSKALQQNKNLLLSLDAEVDTKPQLEIYANDVMCSHGATVGQISEEALFYFLSRGISREEAIRFLIDAFTETNLSLIEDKTLREWIASLLHAHVQGDQHVEH